MQTQSSDSYSPRLPLKAVWKGVLSQDVITSATIPVDSTSPSPVAVFTNPASGGRSGKPHPEALAIINTGHGRQLHHVARHGGTDGGWKAIPLFGGQPAEQVAAGVAYARTSKPGVYGLFLHEDKLHWTSLGSDGATWSAPKQAGGAAVTKLRAVYSPAGRLVIYGANTAGNLITAYQPQPGGDFIVAKECVMPARALASGDFHLCMTDEDTWSLLANVDGKAHLATGVLDAAEPRSFDVAPGFKETVKQVVLGYWSRARKTVIYLLVGGDDALHAWSQSQSKEHVQKIANRHISQAAGHVAQDGSLHVYAVDSGECLWVLHQTKKQFESDGAPSWAPFLPLDQGMASVVGDMNPMAKPALFALAADGYGSLRLHAQDARTGRWKSHKVLQHSPSAFEVTRFRTEVSLVDANGLALPNRPVTLAVEKGGSTVDVWAAGKVNAVDDTGVPLRTDATGRLTFSVLATSGLACPNLVVSSQDMDPVTVRPSGETHKYLSGEGTLHPTQPGGPLPVFDEQGKTLARLAPGASDDLRVAAAQAIRHGAAVAAGTSKVAGFHGSFKQGRIAFHACHSAAELDAHRKRLELYPGGVELQGFFDDLFEGIRNGVAKIVEFVVDVAKKTIDLVLEIAKEIKTIAGLVFEGIEKVADFIAGVFHAVAAAIEKVVDWLKALFNFEHIWNTKMAFEGALLQFPGYVQGMARSGQKAADKWFASKKREVNQYLDEMKAKYSGQTFPGQPRQGDSIADGRASVGDSTSNTHHNWLQDKVASYASDDGFPDRQDDPWAAFLQHLGDAGKEFEKALGDFRDLIVKAITDPGDFAKMGIPTFIDMVKNLVDALLDLCDAAVDGLAGVVVDAMKAVDLLLKAELRLGPLNTLWQWLAEQAKHPGDGKLTTAALVSLVAAFPSTLIYKLINGVDQQPFPNGKMPVQGAGGLGTMPKAARTVSAILQMVQVIPTALGSVLGEAAPLFLAVIGFGFTVLVWFLANGLPDLTALEWTELSVAASHLLVIVPLVVIFLRGQKAVMQKLKKLQPDLTALGFTAAGAVLFVVGIIADATKKPRPAQAIANVLSPLSLVFEFLTFSRIRTPQTVGLKVFFDSMGCLGGGALQLVAVLESPTAAEV
ncbi:MAG: hypothetical protein ACJ759_04720 [Thermoanaerobaculia bacterium]